MSGNGRAGKRAEDTTNAQLSQRTFNHHVRPKPPDTMPLDARRLNAGSWVPCAPIANGIDSATTPNIAAMVYVVFCCGCGSFVGETPGVESLEPTFVCSLRRWLGNGRLPLLQLPCFCLPAGRVCLNRSCHPLRRWFVVLPILFRKSS